MIEYGKIFRVVGTFGATAVTIGLLSAGAADADTFVPLPDGRKAGPEGVVITRTDEHALVSASLAGNGAGRVVWVSGIAQAEVPNAPATTVGPFSIPPEGGPGSNNSSTHGASQLNSGYIVGCQVSIADDAVSAGATAGASPTGAHVGGSIGVELRPGQVRFVQIDFVDITKPGRYSVEYRDAEISIQGCGGYAQARAYTVVEGVGDSYSKTTLYGQPFSIG